MPIYIKGFSDEEKRRLIDWAERMDREPSMTPKPSDILNAIQDQINVYKDIGIINGPPIGSELYVVKASVKKPDPYNREPHKPSMKFDMLVAEARCVCCKTDMPRGTLVRMRPWKGSHLHETQCGPCAAKEVLPLWDEHQAWIRRNHG